MIYRDFIDEGWHSYECQRPSSHVVVEFARDDRYHRQLPWFGKAMDLPPEFNIAGLWWRVP